MKAFIVWTGVCVCWTLAESPEAAVAKVRAYLKANDDEWYLKDESTAEEITEQVGYLVV